MPRREAPPAASVPKTRTAYGDRAFLCVAPSLWNKLSDHVRNMHCLETFQGHVKAHFIYSAILVYHDFMFLLNHCVIIVWVLLQGGFVRVRPRPALY